MKKVILMALLLVPMSIFAQKFGHFDSSAIIQLMPEYTTAQTEIQQLQAQYENDLKRMQDELKKKSEEYEKEKANLLDNVRQRRETELQDLYKMQAISDKMLGVIKQIGTEGGYVYIMDVSAGIPYISTTLSTDVTADIKQKLGLK